MRVALALGLAALLAACGDGDRVRLNVRTTLPGELRNALEAGFEARHPGIDLRFSDDSTEETLEALRKGEADFDVWWGAPASALLRAGGDLEWSPWLTSPLVVAFDRTVVALADAPIDWIDVFHHAWFEAIRIPDPAATEAGATLVGGVVVEALRDDDDLTRGFDWLARLHDQVDRYVQSADEAVAGLGTGDALLAVMTRADAETARTGEAPWLHYRIPASGTPEATLGVAVVAGSARADAARAFLDYLASDEAATAAKLHMHWEPVAGRVDESRLPADFELPGGWTPYVPAFDTLRTELDGWIDRWEREVRTR